MPRLLKRMLPVNRNPFIEVPDPVLSVIEYSSLSYLLDRRGLSAEHKLFAMIILGVTYEQFILRDYGDAHQTIADNDKFINARNN